MPFLDDGLLPRGPVGVTAAALRRLLERVEREQGAADDARLRSTVNLQPELGAFVLGRRAVAGRDALKRAQLDGVQRRCAYCRASCRAGACTGVAALNLANGL